MKSSTARTNCYVQEYRELETQSQEKQACVAMVRRMLIRKNLEFSPLPSVHLSAMRFLGLPSLLFLKLCSQLGLVSMRKMSQALLPFCTFWPKIVQNCDFGPKCPKMEVSHFFAIRSLEFRNFCTKPSLWSRKKMTFSHFLGKFKNFLGKFGPFFIYNLNYIYCLWFFGLSTKSLGT